MVEPICEVLHSARSIYIRNEVAAAFQARDPRHGDEGRAGVHQANYDVQGVRMTFEPMRRAGRDIGSDQLGR